MMSHPFSDPSYSLPIEGVFFESIRHLVLCGFVLLHLRPYSMDSYLIEKTPFNDGDSYNKNEENDLGNTEVYAILHIMAISHN